MYEDDVEYAAKRLNETLVRKMDNSLFFVTSTEMGEQGVVHHGINYATDKGETVPHKDILLEPIPLGFVNSTANMLYVCRKPMRRDWRQGLSTNSLVVYGELRRSFNMKLLVQPLTNQYPSFNTALGLIEKKESVAFSRDFGLTQKEETLLVYRKYPVGKIVNGVAVLNRDKFFLQQHLEEAVA